MRRGKIVKLGVVMVVLVMGVLWAQGDAQTPAKPRVNGGGTERGEILQPQWLQNDGGTELLAQVGGAPAADGAALQVSTPWLHVEIETKYAWIYQKSIARAWTTVSRDDTTRVNVGKLCLKLEAYTDQQVCWADTSYIELTDMKRRVATKKKVAVATAWAEDPVLDSVRVEMTP